MPAPPWPTLSSLFRPPCDGSTSAQRPPALDAPKAALLDAGSCSAQTNLARVLARLEAEASKAGNTEEEAAILRERADALRAANRLRPDQPLVLYRPAAPVASWAPYTLREPTVGFSAGVIRHGRKTSAPAGLAQLARAAAGASPN